MAASTPVCRAGDARFARAGIQAQGRRPSPESRGLRRARGADLLRDAATTGEAEYVPSRRSSRPSRSGVRERRPRSPAKARPSPWAPTRSLIRRAARGEPWIFREIAALPRYRARAKAPSPREFATCAEHVARLHEFYGVPRRRADRAQASRLVREGSAENAAFRDVVNRAESRTTAATRARLLRRARGYSERAVAAA